MAEITNTFIKGSMNKDLDERLIPEGQYVDALNIDVETTEGQDAGAAKNKLGNTMVANLATVSGTTPVDARTIGAIEYEALNKIYWFVASDTFDGIYEYDEETGTTTRVLQSTKASPGAASQLGFSKEYAITGVNYINGPEGNDYLYWTDDFNPPRRVNISRAKSYTIDDTRIDSDINVILEPPLFAPSIDTYTDNSIDDSNNMSEKFLYFSYRYKYVDDQYSSMSPFSAVAFSPDAYNYDYGVGNNKAMTNKFNSVRVTVETGNQFVKEIQILVRDTRNINVSIIDSFSKDKLNIPDDFSYVITFNNNKIYAAISDEQVTRLYDNVPLLAKAQDVVGNRLAYGNYVQFRDISLCNDSPILINYNLDLEQTDVIDTNPMPTWRSDRDYEIGIVYLDEFGRMTTVLNAADPSYNSIYVPALNSDKANTIKLTIKSKAPCWATHYRVYVKQAKKSYYNVFPILFYQDGLFKYFLINQSDLNKIKVGEYVIFKSTSAGPTYSNKKYKILELEVKPAGFISGAIEGVYFKIKVDNPNELSGQGVEIYTSNGQGCTGSNGGLWGQAMYPPEPIDVPGTYVDYPVFYGDGDESGVSLVFDSVIGQPGGVVPIANYNNTDNEDTRITVQIDGPSTYSIYKNSINVYTQQNNNVLVSSGNIISQGIQTSILGYFSVVFNQPTYNIGDRWIFNCRTNGFISKSVAIIPGLGWDTEKEILTGAIVEIQIVQEQYNDGNGWNDNQQSTVVFDPSPQDYKNIEEWWYESGARDAFNYYDISGNNIHGSLVRFRKGDNWDLTPSSGGNNNALEGNRITYNPNGPTRMFIYSSVPDNPGNNGSYAASLYNQSGNDNVQSQFVVSFKITQQQNLNICETVPVEEDADIYHEMFQTYPIENGYHKVLWAYDDFEFYTGNYTRLRQFDKSVPHYFNVGDIVDVSTALTAINGVATVIAVENAYSIVINKSFPGAGPAVVGTVSLSGVIEQDQSATQSAVIKINKPMSDNTEFNAWCFGNGLESDRIYDDFNETRKDFSPRVQVPIEDYKQIRNEAAICYSGVFQTNSSLNRLNEFNLSISNFKYLDRDFGSIQKLFARDTDIVVFQENKVSTVLYGKNVLFDSVGGGQVVSVPEVLGTQVPMAGEWGISRNPESFAKWADDVYFTDARRGVVLQMAGNQILTISSLGMTDYFRDLMKDNPKTQKLGAYDPHNNMYVLSINDQKIIPCELTIAPTSKFVPRNGISYSLFSITTDADWSITLVDIGFGTAWVTNIYNSSGVGNQDIYATLTTNTTGVNRSVEFEITYCSGLTETFTLTQSRAKKGRGEVYVFSNPNYSKEFEQYQKTQG